MTQELHELFRKVRTATPQHVYIENKPETIGYCARNAGLEKPSHPLAAQGWETRDREITAGEPARMHPQFRVAFGQGEFVQRWRDVPDATDDADAIQKTLARSKPGAMPRLKRLRNSIQAYVSRPNELCHPNGRPILIHGYKLQLG